MKSRIFISLLFLFIISTINATISTRSLKTEGMTNPLGIDVEKPRFSWKTDATTEQNVMQKAYHILVASSVEKLAKNEADVWNSGKVNSGNQLW
ncbi:MAG TPA: hypothetical protein P5084_10680, partial [Paludibacter sp.]|nr:hypothetical protein [Paludibacter sp.]